MKNIGTDEVVAAITFAGLLAFFFFIAFIVAGCGSNIPLPGEEPTCVEQVADECVPEVIEEFCAECDTSAAYREGFEAAATLCATNAGFKAGFEAASELCAANRPVCETCDVCEDDEDSDDECKDNGHHYGNHKRDCHGKKHK